MATYRIVERKKPNADGSVDCRYYVQRRYWVFGWWDETYAEPGGEIGISRKYWFDTFDAAWLHIFKKPSTQPADDRAIETIVVQYLNV